MNRFNESFRLR